MQNLRILEVKVTSSTTITATFTENLTSQLSIDNVYISSETINVNDPKVLSVSVKDNELSIECQPLTNLAAYYVKFKSTSNNPFISLNGDAIILNDDVSSRYLVLGPADPENPIKTYLSNFLREGIYNIDDDTTVVSSYVRGLSEILAKSLYDIRQAKNENYISLDVIDELKVRGAGPFDRLDKEGAYEVSRVGLSKSGSNVSKKITFDVFPTYPITLQKQDFSESLIVGSEDNVGIFNVNTLTLNLSKTLVTKLKSIVFTLNTVNQVYTYNIEKYGYQILNNRYSRDYAFEYFTLNDNQIRLSDYIKSDPLFDIKQILKIDVEYEYKDKGIVLTGGYPEVYTSLPISREVLPPILNVFSLKNAPIVDNNGEVPLIGGVKFINSDNLTEEVHPAFKTEIPFRLNGLPILPGQYCIDYQTGTVYVFGEDHKNDGSGPTPPLASYKYQLTYKNEQDYTFDESSLEIVSLPLGNLLESSASVKFNYEKVLVPNVDYVAKVHNESLNERIQNNLLALNVIRVKNSPITSAFRVYNETSGEVYSIQRWNNDKVYYTYNNPPTVNKKILERATFNVVSGELIYYNSSTTNSYLNKIFKIYLNNNNIVSESEDGIASFVNTSLSFSNVEIFKYEKYFNLDLGLDSNLNNLKNVGEYSVDYLNGIVYCCVSSSQETDNLGFVNYKNNKIITNYPHIISVDDVYYQIRNLGQKNKQFEYVSFEDGFIIPKTLERTDQYYYEDAQSLYNIYSKFVGIFDNYSNFVPGVSQEIKSVRGLYEYEDFSNSINPINFSSFCTPNNYNVEVNTFSKVIFTTVKYDGTDYYVLIDENVPYLSSNINYEYSVERIYDSSELWDNNGIVVTGSTLKLILSGINSPNVNDEVKLTYNFTIKDFSNIVVDYNKGDFYIDYSYLQDEILVSYEYGDNVLDFRSSTSVPANSEYYVTYKAGALRDALYKNFGNLVNIPELTNFDLDFDRERYRDAVSAALSSFIQGPTISAMKNIGKTISHIEPKINESAFQSWSLGSSLLEPKKIKTTGDFNLLPAKYSNGVLVNSPNQTISFPTSSNIRLEEGTFETWIVPEWNGLENDAELIFNITKNNLPINKLDVFIGASEYHPDIVNGQFILNKKNNIHGSPNLNKDGIFIYYDKDISGSFNRWYVKIVDGYVDSGVSTYKFKVTTNGGFYDSKTLTIPKPSNVIMFTGLNTLNVTFNGGSGYLDDGFTFLSDIDHYILDFGDKKDSSRLSIYKDISGYINFRIYDEKREMYIVSADVSNWKSGDAHHVAASWKLNSTDGRDEMHLFIDGLEVPNIIKYGQKVRPYLHEKFRTIDPEEIVALSNRDIISSTDLVTVEGQSLVSSSINFSAKNIFVGDTIYIDEIGFNSNGYTIVSMNGQELVLDDVMPKTLSNAKFSVNRTNFNVNSDIDVASNIAISVLKPILNGDQAYIYSGSNIVTTEYDLESLGVLPGYLIRIEDNSLEKSYYIIEVSSNTVKVIDNFDLNLSSVSYSIYNGQDIEIPGIRAQYPSYSISKDVNYNNILTISNNVDAKDLILIRTLGLNNRSIKHNYYVWGDSYENIIMTKLPPPISLDEANFTKIVVPPTIVNSNNSYLSGSDYISNNIDGSRTSNSQTGRTLSVTIRGNNIDFSTPVEVTINGVYGVYTVSETVTFTDYGTLDLINTYYSVNFITVKAKPINSAKDFVTVECREKYVITKSEFSGLVPHIKYSYYLGGGETLYSDDGYTVTDVNNIFSELYVGSYIIIIDPISVAGYYTITSVSNDRKNLTIQGTVPSMQLPLSAFSNGKYIILKSTEARSGLQNGFFRFEPTLLTGQEYFLVKGFYEIKYKSYTNIRLSPKIGNAFIGSDFNGKNQINSIIDQVKVYSVMLTDTRIGETIPQNERSITKDYNSLKQLTADENTLMLINFDEYPFVNQAGFYINSYEYKNNFLSSKVVNENFGNSLIIKNDPIVIENNGILNTFTEGTVEFWVNPMFDTGNDPQNRYYFDAYGAIVEEVVSNTNSSLELMNPASKILSVKLKGGNKNLDYFAGGSIDISTKDAIQETVLSVNPGTVIVDKEALQIVKVQIVGDLTEKDYFEGGTIGSNKKTIYLGKTLPSSVLSLLVTYKPIDRSYKLNSQIIRLNRRLPSQNSTVIVNYIPKGLQGDRISLYKDKFGYFNFSILASEDLFEIKVPIYWSRNTWHRVKASYKLNNGIGSDEMRLFLDGYEYSNTIYTGNKILSSWNVTTPLDGYYVKANIKFKDQINTLFVGSEYDFSSPIFSLIDNLRISNVSRPIYSPYGEPLDVNYTPNLNVAFPVTPDLYTTYLLESNNNRFLNDDFAVIKNKRTGSFNFSINILDSFGIVNDSIKSQEALEKLIKVLKPANSKVIIQYTR